MTFRCPTVWSTALCASVPRLLDSAPSQTPFELRYFLPCNALFIPNRGKATHLSLGPRPISLSLFFNATLWHRETPLSRSSIDPFFFNAIPWHRATPLSWSSTDPFFFNAILWHGAILLSRSATDLSPFFLTPPRGTERHCSLGPP